MHLTAEVQEQIRRFVVGQVDADSLSEWLDVRAQVIHDDHLASLTALVALAHSLLEATGDGLLPEDAARLRLREELERAAVSFVPSPWQIVTGSSAADITRQVAAAVSVGFPPESAHIRREMGLVSV